MDQSELSQAQRLAEAFDQFNELSEQLSTSYRRLEQRLRRFGADPGASPAGGPVPAGERLQETDRLEAVLEAVPAGIVVLDGDGVVRRFNAAAVDLLGVPLQDIAWREVIDRAFRPGRDIEALTLKDGRAVALRTSPLAHGPGQVILLHDITESREFQAIVQRQQRLSSMGEMVATVAHQVRTPLASSLLYVSRLEHGAQSSDQRRAVEKIRACLEHLGRVVEDMLAFARGGTFESRHLAVAELLETVGQLVGPQLAVDGCRLEVEDGSAGAAVSGNRDALVAALQNLISNGAQACRSARESTGESDGASPGCDLLELAAQCVKDRAGAEWVEITVRDNGPGIAPETRERIFDPFFTTKSRGTGLGLPVVQAIVQAHDGALWVASEPGQGTTVRIRLPLASADDAGEDPDALAARPEAGR